MFLGVSNGVKMRMQTLNSQNTDDLFASSFKQGRHSLECNDRRKFSCDTAGRKVFVLGKMRRLW